MTEWRGAGPIPTTGLRDQLEQRLWTFDTLSAETRQRATLCAFLLFVWHSLAQRLADTS